MISQCVLDDKYSMNDDLNKRITGEDLAAMMPEAVAKMMEVMSHYGKKYDPETKTYSDPNVEASRLKKGGQ